MFESPRGVIGICMNGGVRFLDGDPTDNARVGAWGRVRVYAFEDFAGAAMAHVIFEDGLLRPMEEFVAEIREPEVRADERDHEFVGLEELCGGIG